MKCVLMSSTNVQTHRTEEEEEVRVRGVKGDTSITRAVITIIVLCVKSWSCVCHGSWSWVTYLSTVLGTWAEERTQFRLVSDIIALHSSITCCNCNWVIRNPETAEQGGDRGEEISLTQELLWSQHSQWSGPGIQALRIITAAVSCDGAYVIREGHHHSYAAWAIYLWIPSEGLQWPQSFTDSWQPEKMTIHWIESLISQFDNTENFKSYMNDEIKHLNPKNEFEKY